MLLLFEPNLVLVELKNLIILGLLSKEAGEAKADPVVSGLIFLVS